MAELLPRLTPEHRNRVTRALATLEQAQHLIGDAGELLSPVPGMAEEWEAVRALYFEARERRDARIACLFLLEAD